MTSFLVGGRRENATVFEYLRELAQLRETPWCNALTTEYILPMSIKRTKSYQLYTETTKFLMVRVATTSS